MERMRCMQYKDGYKIKIGELAIRDRAWKQEKWKNENVKASF